MMEMLEHYRETHEAIFRYKSDNTNKEELSEFLINIGQSLKTNNGAIEITKILRSKDKTATTAGTKSSTIIPVDPIAFKLLYVKAKSQDLKFTWN